MIVIVQRLIGWVGSPLLARFMRLLDDPKAAQSAIAKKLISDLSDCEYGRSHGLHRELEIADFQKLVPLNQYPDLEKWIERQKIDGTTVLNPSPVVLYEKTSGSSGAAKWIPYTHELKRCFSRMALLWITDICKNGPRLSSGRFFMSVSPAFSKEKHTVIGIPVGLEDDSEYLPFWLRILGRRFFVAPAELKKLKTPDDYRFVLSCLLIGADDLEVISIWNPTYFTAILNYISENQLILSQDLVRGVVQRSGLTFKFKKVSPERITLISQGKWAALWPKLKIISAWADAGAAKFAQQLKEIFPQAYFQAKGLLATEAPMTIPWVNHPMGGVPLVGQVFFEFINDQGEICLLHELTLGKSYEIIVSPLGGLPRYRTGDLVEVTGQIGKTPCFKFRGRVHSVSDMVGEKLNESFVRERFNAHSELGKLFYFLFPSPNASPPHYILAVDSQRDLRDSDTQPFDELLCEALHYRYARQLEQLGPVEVWNIRELKKIYYDYFVAQGMKMGDIKYSALIYRLEDAHRLESLLANLKTKSRA